MNAAQADKPLLSLDVAWSTVSFALAAEALVHYLQTGAGVLLAFVALNAQAGYLFWTRNDARPLGVPGHGAVESAGRGADLLAVTSLLLVELYEVAPGYGSGRDVGEAIMALGAVLCFMSCWALGPSFGVLPRYRGIRTGGLYKVIRHPVYASIIVLELGYITAHPTVWNMWLGLIGAILLIARAILEERLLAPVPEYAAYTAAVRYRLLPGIW